MGKFTDEWETPQELFDELDKEFNFDIDLCANFNNKKCDMWSEDYLNDIITNCNGEPDRELANLDWDPVCFMNPPYSNPRPFIEKAWEDSKYCKIVCLVKCDPSTKWWATFWDYELSKHFCKEWDWLLITNKDDEWQACLCNKKYNGPKPGCEVRFFPKRIKFSRPGITCPCNYCVGIGSIDFYGMDEEILHTPCHECNGCGFITYDISAGGSPFPCALVIMDRRQL